MEHNHNHNFYCVRRSLIGTTQGGEGQRYCKRSCEPMVDGREALAR